MRVGLRPSLSDQLELKRFYKNKSEEEERWMVKTLRNMWSFAALLVVGVSTQLAQGRGHAKRHPI